MTDAADATRATGAGGRGVTAELVDAFIRLARGDFTVRLARNYTRDTDDLLAYFVNLIGEELQRLLRERDASLRELEAGVAALSEAFLRIAAGDFSARVTRSERGDPMDVLAYLLNNTAGELGDVFAALDRERHVVTSILDAMVDGVLLIDTEGRIQRANAAMAHLLGRKVCSCIGQPVSEILAARDVDLAAQLRGALAAGRFTDRVVRFRGAGDEIVALTVNGSVTTDAAGTPTGIVLVARDDRALQQAQARLRMTDRLAGVGTIAAGVAHELNNPLAFMIANLDFALEELADPDDVSRDVARRDELVKALAATRQGAHRMRQIVKELKTFSRVDQDALADVDLPDLLDSALNMLRNEIRHHARLVRQYEAPPLVRANEGRLVQVFVNLIQNAAQAMPAGRAATNEIRVRCRAGDGGDAVVEISDTGEGIAPADLPRIFDAFYTTKPAGVGTGLGLSISREIVAAFGGRIEVDSTVGVGTTVRVVLPAAIAAAAAAHAAPAASPSGDQPVSPSRRLRVLVVDDEIEIGHAITRALGHDHDLVVVHRGADALALLAAGENHFDAVLCDVMMPELTGLELHAALAALRPALARRVVFMTGGAFAADDAEALERTGRPRLDKPFDAATLRAALRAAAAA